MNAIESKIIEKISKRVREKFLQEGSGHDWWHIYRVWKNAVYIAKKEKADMFTVQLASLLHDIADWKFYDGDQNVGAEKSEEILSEFNVDFDVIDKVKVIIRDLSFKGAGVVEKKMASVEGEIVRDSDRLDAMGAIGIARVFAYGGHKGRIIYDPEVNPVKHMSPEEYVKNNSPSINHFYEKLLLLQNRMNTASGKRIAGKRHQFMQAYLDQFYKELDLKA